MEQEGVPTTQISLIRLHTEKMTPPRALWVPFELGRPLGVPNDPDFQTRVLQATLGLLEAPSGPIIEDYAEDAPASAAGEMTVLACPVNLNVGESTLTETEKLIARFKEEIIGLRQWYDIAVDKRGRTTVGVSRMSPEEIGEFMSTLVTGQIPENSRTDISITYLVNLAINDLRAYYAEGITGQPGQESLTGKTINHWFWAETAASSIIYTLRDVCKASEDKSLKKAGKLILIPVEFL